MVQIDIVYEGGLHTHATHKPSGATLSTDAPVDNNGRGEAFSPTDLLATALGTCMLTIMGMVAARENVALEGARVRVEKHMTQTPPRRVAKLNVIFDLPDATDVQRRKLENAAHTCPVHHSLHPDVVIDIIFNWNMRRQVGKSD
jgi:putative redox protein